MISQERSEKENLQREVESLKLRLAALEKKLAELENERATGTMLITRQG